MKLSAAPTFRGPARIAWIALSIALVTSLVPAGADAKPIKSKISGDVFGVINRQATVTYYFGGTVTAQDLTFGCMEGRRVALFRVEEGGAQRRVASGKVGFFGSFSETLEKPFSAIPGRYFVKVEPRIRRSKKGKLRCLAARTPAFLVKVPAGLLTE